MVGQNGEVPLFKAIVEKNAIRPDGSHIGAKTEFTLCAGII